MSELNIRHLRNFLAVAETSNVTRAAELLGRTQTAVTKSIHSFEDELGIPLFDRSVRGMALTSYGEVMQVWGREAAEEYKKIALFIAPVVVQNSSGVERLIKMDISNTWVTAFLAIAEKHNMTSAAELLDVSRSTVSASLRKFEGSLGFPLIERTPNALFLTHLGVILMKHLKLAQRCLENARNELSSMQGVECGHIAIGAAPFVTTFLLPEAIKRLLKSHQYLEIFISENTYAANTADLRCGNLDFMIGVTQSKSNDMELMDEPVFEDRLALIVRKGHELDGRELVEWDELKEHGWIIPPRWTPTRRLFEEELNRKGLTIPKRSILTSSWAMFNYFLTESNYIALLPRSAIYREEKIGSHVVLPVHFLESRVQIGFTFRSSSTLSPAVHLLLEEIRKVAKSIH